MQVRRLRADEASAWRDLRLRALADSPDAFEATYEATSRMAEAAWEERTRALAEGREHVMFVADADGLLVGAAGGFLDVNADGIPHLISMWVAPGARRRGLGRALTMAVVGWARECGAPAIRLFVVGGNFGAAELYRGCGFASTGVVMPMGRQPDLVEEEMRLALE